MHRSTIPALAALVLFATQASAQRYNIRKPPELLDELSIGASFILPCDVSMKNLGNIPFTYYDEGSYIDATVEADGKTAEDGKTYNFLYNSIMQLTDAEGNPNFEGAYLKATNAKAEATDGLFEENGDTGVMKGVDINYTRYFNKKHHFGLTAGMSTSGFSLRRSRSWDVTVTTRSDLYAAEGLEGMSDFTGNQERPRVFSDDEPEVYLYINDPIDLGETVLGDTTTADGVWDLKTAYVSFRLGAVYNLTLNRRWLMHMGGGLTIMSASSRFRWDETYTAELDSGDYDIEENDQMTKHKFLFGGWADLGAQYRINRYVNAYSSVQLQSTSSLSYETNYGHRIELDSSKMYAIKTGFSWSF